MTVLGKSPAMPDAGGANSGYLIRHAGFTLLLDCGSGVFSKLRGVCDQATVDAVLITHMHADHMLDVLPFSHALTYHGRGSAKTPVLLAPPGGAQTFATVGTALGMENQVAEAFELTEYDPQRELGCGPLTISFREVPHYISTWACDLRCDDGRRLTFGADCGPNEAVVELGRDSDLLMLEATEGAGPHTGPAFRGHLTAAEAGELGRRAGARRLLLTHYSDVVDAVSLRSAAEETFAAPVELALAGASYAI